MLVTYVKNHMKWERRRKEMCRRGCQESIGMQLGQRKDDVVGSRQLALFEDTANLSSTIYLLKIFLFLKPIDAN